MFRPRIIPCLLLKDMGIVKTVQFDDPKYVGDPINAVRLFNDFKADELIFLDIEASIEKRSIDLDFVKLISEAAFMPFAVGGGIRTLEEAQSLILAGAEKVVINTAFAENPELVFQIANKLGNQSVVVGIDVRQDKNGLYQVLVKDGEVVVSETLEEYAKKAERYGAGEILVQSVDRDGTMLGYDIDLVRKVAFSVSVPVVALGGAGSYSDFVKVFSEGGASAAAAGSVFVFHGPRKAVLINYPSIEERRNIFIKNV